MRLTLAGWPLPARLGLAALLGAIAAAGLAPLGLWPLTLASLAALPALALAAETGRRAALTGWAFGTGYFAHAMLWIVEPFLVEPERHGWMAPFALVFMAAGLALFWGAAFWAAQVLCRRPVHRVAALIVTLSLTEFARAYLLTGFPWGALAQVWVDTPALALLPWIGPQGLALATLLAAFPVGLAMTGALRWPLALVPGLALAGAVLAAAAARPEPETTGATVRLVQPDIPQDQKWDPAMMPVFFDRQIGFTAAAPRPDLIVWPETAVPDLLNHAEPVLAAIAEAAQGVPVVLGIQRLEGARFFNSLIHLDAAGQVAGLYDKHHLVPFGEYIPLGDLAARFGLRGFAAQQGDGFSAGPGPRLLDLGPLGWALPLICYEAVFPQDVVRAPGRGDLLLQITNDAWFGTRAGPYQHLAQARMRAAEQGLPMVRAANTGISAMIDPLGRVVASLPLGQAGYLDAALPAPLPPTLYARSGDLPVLLLLIAAAVALWVAGRRQAALNQR